MTTAVVQLMKRHSARATRLHVCSHSVGAQARIAYLALYARTPAERRAETAIAHIRALRDELHALTGLQRTLGETGRVRRDQLPAIARLSLDDGALLMNPVEVDADQALALLERAF